MGFLTAEKVLVLPGSEEQISFLRDLSLTINAYIEYKAEGMIGNGHFHVMKTLASEGELDAVLTAIPRGYEGKKPEIVAKFKVRLDEKNSPFGIHCFLGVDNRLNDQNRSLEWKLNMVGDVVFD